MIIFWLRLTFIPINFPGHLIPPYFLYKVLIFAFLIDDKSNVSFFISFVTFFLYLLHWICWFKTYLFFLPARRLIHLYPCPCKSVCLSVCSLSVRLSVCPFVCLSVYLEHLFLYVTQFFNTSHLWLNLPMNIIFYLISHHYFLIYFYMCI